ncbi:MAG: NADH-quinone oxidoreductase subunit H [Acetobacteraceae bacterium]
MTILAALIAQLVHIALTIAAAPTLVGLLRWGEARLAGRAGPPVLQPWHDLARLVRKRAGRVEAASIVTGVALPARLAALGVAASLVPSFTLGMAFSPAADLLMIAGLLAIARAATAVAAMDAGAASGGMAASRVMLLACAAEPALLLVMLVLGLQAGSLNVDLIAAMQAENGGDWRAGAVTALAAVLLVVPVDTMRHDGLVLDLAGPDLAVAGFADALRVLLWCNLVGALFLPFGMAASGASPAAWFAGGACWLVRTLVMAAALVALHTLVGRIPHARAAAMLGVAALLGLLAAAFLFAETRTA